MNTPVKNFKDSVWAKHSDGKVISFHSHITLTEEEFQKLVALNPPHTYIVYIKPEPLK